MKRIVLVSVFTLLNCVLTVGIKCIQCLVQPPKHVCLGRLPACRLYIGQSCYKKTIYFGQAPLFSYNGCTPKCVNVFASPEDMNITQVVRCCSHRNFCNI